MQKQGRTLVACIVAVLTLATMTNLVNADEGSKITIGLSAGPSFSTLTGLEVASNASVSSGTETGFIVGAHVAKELGAKTSGVLGLGFVRKGGGVKYTGVDELITNLSTEYDNTLTLDYVEFSLLFRYVIASSTDIRVLVLAGPALGMNVKAEYDIKAVDIDTNTGARDPWSEVMDVKDRLKKTSFSGIGGVELEKAFESVTVGICAVYSLGLTDFAESIDVVNIDYEVTSGKSSGFTAAVSVGFHI